MAECKRLRRKKRQVCIGDLDAQITLQNRAITVPSFGVPDFDEIFSDIDTHWAKMDTVRGKTFFDGVNTETNITHEFTIRYIDGITTETWVLFESRRFDVLDFEDLEERHEWIILSCVERGTGEAAKA